MAPFRPLAALCVLLAAVTPAACRQAAPRADAAASLSGPGGPLAYPPTRTVDQVDDYHGVTVADPYRWLEDADSEETRAWVEAQNAVTSAYLSTIESRGEIEAELTRLWNYEKFTLPFREGDRYFYSRNDGLQNQNVLYVQDGLDGEPRVLLDPNTLSEDGTIALAGTSVSDDGNYLAYGLSSGGSDWREWRVRDVRTGADLPDLLRWIKFSSVSWTPDNAGFFYSRYDAPAAGEELRSANFFPKIHYHRLGAPQSEDALVYHRPDQKEWSFGATVTEDGKYLGISIFRGTSRKSSFSYRELSAGTSDAPVTPLLTDFDAIYAFLGNDGPVFFFRTNLDAPRGRVISIDVRSPQRAAWREVVPELDETLESASLVGDRFVATYLRDASSRVRVFGLDGRPVRDVRLPGLGTASGFGGRRNRSETFFSFTTFTSPTAIYRHDVATGETTLFKAPKADFDSKAYETKQVFYTSRDGARIPMFIVHRKGLALDGSNPTYLYGYGGFNVSLTPSFSVPNLVFMEMGGVFAMPNLRGGGEYGEAWHEAGMKGRKQNVFDDFIAAAEWLIANGYTSKEKLAIGGGSNGGLLVGAAITQRPDLFGAALPAVGVMDMLRFHKFTVGWGWVSDYGSPDDPADFRALHAYSPLHNIRPGTVYPPTLVTTGDHDDRVVPAHSYKFTAALQAAGGPKPALIRIETRAGHGAGKPTKKQIEETADKWAFLVRELGMKPPRFESALAGAAEAATPANESAR